MTRGCVLPGCGIGPAKKAICCGMRLCGAHSESGAAHDCPEQKRLLEIASSPALKKQWFSDNAPEEELTTLVIAALNKLPGLTVWRSKRKQGPRASTEADSVPDVIGYAHQDARFVGVETKRTCPPNCERDGCSCGRQKDWGARLTAAGGVWVGDARTVQQAVDGVRLGLARARSKTGAAA